MSPLAVFGNFAGVTNPTPALAPRTRSPEPLIGVVEWPGTAASYSVRPGAAGGAPRLVFSLAIQAERYLPAPELDTTVALRTAADDALRWKREVIDALGSSATFSATTTLAPKSASTPIPLSAARFLGFASGAYAFTSQLASLTPVSGTAENRDLLDPASLTAAVFAFRPGQSLHAIAALFGTDAQSLGASIENAGGIFVPDQSVTVGAFGTVTTTAADSLASLLAKFPSSSRPTLAGLIAAIAPATALLRPGAVIVCPAPTVPPAALTLASLGSAFGFDAASIPALGRCNAALDGFLDATRTVSYAGMDLPIGNHETLISLYERTLSAGADAGFDDFLIAIADQTVLAPGAKLILPPPSVEIEADLPASPAVATAITKLDTTVTVTCLASKTATPVAALAPGSPPAYAAFAQGLQDAYGGALRVAVNARGGAVEPARPPLHVVRFAAPGSEPANAIRSIGIRNTPMFFALPPLCRELVTRTVDVRTYRSGSDDPLGGPAQARTVAAVDVQDWARALIGLIDLVLSEPYAAAGIALTRAADGTSPDFDQLVAAKRILAEKISSELAPLFVDDAEDADVESARGAFQRALDASLAAGWDACAVIQLPTTVAATFASTDGDAGGHRFTGQPTAIGVGASTLDLDEADGRLNLLLQVAEPSRDCRVPLDADFPITGLECRIEPAPLAPERERYDRLEFVTPLMGDGADQPARLDVAIGYLSVPVALRAIPAMPRLVGQYAAAAPHAMTIAGAKAWTYTTTFEASTAAQDLVWLNVGFNAAPAAPAAPAAHAVREAATDDLFEALTESATNALAVRADLANLLLPESVLAADEDKRKKAKSAFVAVSSMAARVANHWGPVSSSVAPANAGVALAPEQEFTFSIETRTRLAAGGARLIDSLLLTREGTATRWGPGDRQPRLGYVDAGGAVVMLEPQPAAGAANELAFAISSDVELPASARQLFALVYRDLDAVATQSARAAVWLMRNERLASPRKTSDAFVIRTPEFRFDDPVIPALVVDEPISIGGGAVNGLAAALRAMFADLLGTPPTAASAQLELSVRYVYRLVPSGTEPDGIEVSTPVLLGSLLAYDDTLPAAITDAVRALVDANPSPSGDSRFISVELTVFGDQASGDRQPLLELKHLNYALRETPRT